MPVIIFTVENCFSKHSLIVFSTNLLAWSRLKPCKSIINVDLFLLIEGPFNSSLGFILIGLYMGSSLFTKSTNMSLLSGLLPPEFYSIYNDSNNCPLGFDCIKDFDDGLDESILTNKPILLDFTGWACANCRRVEENTWSVPKVYDLINNQFILISLYVDDRSDLSDEEIISPVSVRVIVQP